MKPNTSTSQEHSQLNAQDRWRVGLNLLLAIFQPLTPYLALLLGGKDIGTRSDESPSLFTPPGYVFAIWGPIFLGMIAYAVYQVRPRNWVNPRLRRVGWFTACAMLLNIMWMVVVTTWGLGIIPGVIIALMWAALMGAFFNLYSNISPTRSEQALIIFPVSIFSAWITVATLAGVAGLLTQSQVFDGTVL
jgi:translocator protein